MMNYRCSGCGESGIAPGACDRCNCEYLPDETGAIDGVPQQLHRRPWRHFVIANATTAFTNIYVDDRWLDGAGHLIKLGSLVVLGFLLFLPLTLIPDGYRTLHVVLAQVWILATLVLNTVLWSLFSARVGGLSYRAYAAVVMSERAIRASSRFTSVAAVTEGPAILVGETTPVETVSREGADPVLAIQGFEATGTLRDDPALQYDGSAPRMRPSIGGDFLLSDGSGSPISVRAEHVVIESPDWTCAYRWVRASLRRATSSGCPARRAIAAATATGKWSAAGTSRSFSGSCGQARIQRRPRRGSAWTSRARRRPGHQESRRPLRTMKPRRCPAPTAR
nr:hypothetical protein [Deltaproteobacteria bacterium]